MAVDLLDPEYAIPSEAAQWVKDGARPLPDVPPKTGPELAAMRLDSIEDRLRALEHRLSQLERAGVISSAYLYMPVPGTVPAAPSHNHNEGF